MHRTGGRNNNGRITTRHQGGGHKRRYRIIDFKRTKDGVPAKVASIEYDPNRTARIALLHYADGAKAYIIAPQRLTVGATSSPAPTPTSGPATRCRSRPSRSARRCTPSSSGPARAHGCAARPARRAQLVAKEGGKALLRLPSGELRRVAESCRATIGSVGNATHQNESGGKAGRARWLGQRPGVRGTAMNPVDHPHGGGEGKTKGSHPVTPVGQADARPPHPQSQEGLHRGDRPRTQAWQGQEVDDE